MEQRTLHIGDRTIYCYEDGSVEFLSRSARHKGNPLVRTFGATKSKGYKQILLVINRKPTHLLVHRLIALAFHPNLDDLPEVDHINRDKTDNTPKNLRWCSAAINNNNTSRVLKSLATYGCQRTKEPKRYYSSYYEKHVSLIAIQPNGKGTTYHFQTEDDPVYKALKPLSQRDRYFKYKELEKLPIVQ